MTMTKTNVAEAQAEFTASTSTEGKVKPDSTMVQMTDGRVVEFVGKRRAIKTSNITPENKIQIQIDFINGETRLFTVPEDMVLRFAAHGALQKLGDSYSNLSDPADAVQTLDELIDRLYDGKWVAEREPGEAKASVGGSSLHKALMEVSGKSKEEITSFLASKTPAEKAAIKLSPKVAPIYQRLEAERLQKSGKVEAGEEQLAELGI